MLILFCLLAASSCSFLASFYISTEITASNVMLKIISPINDLFHQTCQNLGTHDLRPTCRIQNCQYKSWVIITNFWVGMLGMAWEGASCHVMSLVHQVGLNYFSVDGWIRLLGIYYYQLMKQSGSEQLVTFKSRFKSRLC